ncbi:hypothetical protein LAZ67_13000734 [Cordylochernes scorpioides]|uniref:PiggyBac transposable element-derived protein domain-containing protein n=1 Tax=Cordylochernes scorpioides TaxID=51811 RepID=A0ABY6L420_9ARAC|nr:hypothetical protein LAZ67_13000734 [Cordylochernes scorpioides]
MVGFPSRISKGISSRITAVTSILRLSAPSSRIKFAYGIITETYVLCCSRKSYVLNLEIYAGKQPEGPYQISNSPNNVVERLVLPISGSKRNITTDN